MKKLLVIIILSITTLYVSKASTYMRIGFRGGAGTLSGEVSQQWFEQSKFNTGMGLYFGYPLNANFMLNATTEYQELHFENDFSTYMYIPGFYGEYFFPTTSFLKPYLEIGTKLGIYYQDNFSSNEYTFIPSIGWGFDIPISDRITISFSARRNYTFRDDLDGKVGGNSNDYFSDLRLGFSYRLKEVYKNTIYKRETMEDTVLSYEQKLQIKEREKEELRDRYENKIESLKAQNEQLRGELERIQNYYSGLADSLSSLVQKKNQTIDSLKEGGIRVARAPADISWKDVEEIVDVNKYYRITVDSIMYRSKNYPRALARLERLQRNYPEHEYISNFIYMKGECYFAIEKYSLALEHFEKVQEYQESHKLDDALFMLGYTNYTLGNNQKAKSYFQEFTQKFPQSEYINSVEIYMKKL